MFAKTMHIQPVHTTYALVAVVYQRECAHMCVVTWHPYIDVLSFGWKEGQVSEAEKKARHIPHKSQDDSDRRL